MSLVYNNGTCAQLDSPEDPTSYPSPALVAHRAPRTPPALTGVYFAIALTDGSLGHGSSQAMSSSAGAAPASAPGSLAGSYLGTLAGASADAPGSAAGSAWAETFAGTAPADAPGSPAGSAPGTLAGGDPAGDKR